MHGIGVADVAQHDVGAVEQGSTLDGELHGVQGALVAVEQDELGGLVAVELPCDLGADGAARSGDQHALGGDVAGDGVDVGVDAVASQQIGFGHGPDVAQTDFAEEVLHAGEDQQLEPAGRGLFAGSSHHVGTGRGDGHQQVPGIEAGGDGAGVGERALDPHAVDGIAALGGVVVEEGHREEGALGVAQHAGEDLRSAVAGTEHDDPLHLRRARAFLAVEPHPVGESHRRGEPDGDGRGDERHGPGPEPSLGQERGDDQQHADGEHDPHEGGDLLEGGEAPPARVEPQEAAEHHLTHDGHQAEREDVGGETGRRCGEVEPQPQGEQHGRHPGRAVDERLHHRSGPGVCAQLLDHSPTSPAAGRRHRTHRLHHVEWWRMRQTAHRTGPADPFTRWPSPARCRP